MLTLLRTIPQNNDFLNLIKQLDAGLKITDGDEHAFYDQFNKIDHIKYVVVAYQDDLPVGCGAIKHFDDATMEVKRMFVPVDQRGKGVASMILQALENWAGELGFVRTILETGSRQTEALGLYQKCGYAIIENYGQYVGVMNSICFEKRLV